MEPLTQTIVVRVEDPSQVSVARRAANELARAARLSEQRISELNIVVVELANNLLQHAGGGQLYMRYLAPISALDIAAVDHGRGIPNIALSMQDGFTTASTPGLGLGAIRRFATRFDAYSVADRTTVIAARMSEVPALIDFSVVSTALHGETLSGDSWSVSEDGCSFLVVDGLGHGMLAHDAARAAVEVFQAHQHLAAGSILETMHASLRSTRGAAAAVLRVAPDAKTVDFAGIGNIGCMIFNGTTTQSLVSHNGTLGHQVRRVQEFRYSYRPGNLLIMQSDGLTSHSKRGIPPLLLNESPRVIAPFLYSEQVRGRDDATILVARLA